MSRSKLFNTPMQFFLQNDAELLEYIQGYSGDLSKLDYRKVYDRSVRLKKTILIIFKVISIACVFVKT